MNRIPTDDEIRQQVQDMRRTDNLWDAFEADVLEIARAARIATGGDGYKTSHGALGGGGGGMKVPDEEMGCEVKVEATVVETMALNDQMTDPMDRQRELLFDMLNQGATSARAAFNTRDRVKKGRTWEKPHSHTDSPCCEPGCEEPADKAGRCKADYMRKYRYEQKHPGQTCPPLTAAELEARKPKNRRVA